MAVFGRIAVLVTYQLGRFDLTRRTRQTTSLGRGATASFSVVGELAAAFVLITNYPHLAEPCALISSGEQRIPGSSWR